MIGKETFNTFGSRSGKKGHSLPSGAEVIETGTFGTFRNNSVTGRHIQEQGRQEQHLVSGAGMTGTWTFSTFKSSGDRNWSIRHIQEQG